MPAHPYAFLAISFLSIAVCGCGASDVPANPNVAEKSNLIQGTTAETETSGQTPPGSSSAAENSSETTELADALFGDKSQPTPAMSTLENPTPAAAPSLQLKANLSPERLTEFLKLSDLEMQNIASGKAGIFDNKQANLEMIRIGQMKLQAAKQLQGSPAADSAQKVLGIRGQLQALSHLAALGNLKAAQELETLANEQVASDEPTVAEDSRLVLIGLALEKIQNGSLKDPSEVLEHVERIGQANQQPSIAAMMVMGQARVVLEKYGFTSESTLVRNRIVDLFADHPDPNVASMALQVAGTPRFAVVDGLMRQMERGEVVSIATWSKNVDELLAESPDLSAVQFLASAALQHEAAGRLDFVGPIYDALSASTKLGDRERREVQLAIDAYETRRSIVGSEVSLNLPSTDGRPLTLASYRGKIVLMPFWSIEFPESLSVLQLLGEIRENAGGKVEIVGVNLDRADAPFEQFMEESPVQFRSFHSTSTPGKEVVNEAAEQFGIVAMPFVIVIGSDGKVASMDFTGQKLKESVAQLMAKQTPSP